MTKDEEKDLKHLYDQRKIINSKAFRRLSDKTQVIFSGQRNAQVQSRLTHSLEVASIAKEIALNLNSIKKYHLSHECIYNVSLLHDYGMSALGHLGEQTLQSVFLDNTGLVFEANANNLVVIEKNLPDIDLLTIVSTIKYPFLFSSENKEQKKGIYHGQFHKYMPLLEEIINKQNQNENVKRTRTYECDIMELSDDLAYLFSDLVDAISAYDIKISEETLYQFFQKESLEKNNYFYMFLDIINNKNFDSLENLREQMILDVNYNEELNSIDFETPIFKKLQNIIRTIDFELYIKEFSLVSDSPLIIDYKNFLEMVIALVKKNPFFVAYDIILSNTYRHAYIKAINNNDIKKAYKILLITMAEWTDTTVAQKMKMLEDLKLVC